MAIGLGQLLLGRSSTTPSRLLLLPPLATGWFVSIALATGAFVFGCQRILIIQSLSRGLAITLTQLLPEPRILDLQLVDRLLLGTNGLFQLSDQQAIRCRERPIRHDWLGHKWSGIANVVANPCVIPA